MTISGPVDRSWCQGGVLVRGHAGEEEPEMRACGVTEAGGRVRTLELPDPGPPGAGQVVVAVEAAGVGAWDRLTYTGGWDVGLVPPAALGVEGAGRVVAV
ncbi:alcohol dehydrogenase catalytic domain-containing protein, partial [Actinoallomurus acaciae]